MYRDALYIFLDSLASQLAGGHRLEPKQKDELLSLWSKVRDESDRGLQQLISDLEAVAILDEIMDCEDKYHKRIQLATADIRAFNAHPMNNPTSGGWVYPVFFATNRTKTKQGYSATRASHVMLGKCDVFIPRNRLYGDLGQSILRRMSMFDFNENQVTVKKIASTSKEDYWKSWNCEIAGGVRGARHALLFIHGYRCTFEEAIVRAAQLGVDLNINGATTVFSWPSQGSLFGYAADAAAVEASEIALADYLKDLIRKSDAEVTHIVAHSMGNRLLLRALCSLASEAASASSFGQIVFAAPDVDRDFFLQRAHLIPQVCTRGTVYASADDRAVRVSAWLQGDRVGYIPPVTATPNLERLNTVVVPGVGIDLIGHSYFGQASGLLNDINLLFSNDWPPSRRPRLTYRDEGYWEMTPGRPGA